VKNLASFWKRWRFSSWQLLQLAPEEEVDDIVKNKIVHAQPLNDTAVGQRSRQVADNIDIHSHRLCQEVQWRTILLQRNSKRFNKISSMTERLYSSYQSGISPAVGYSERSHGNLFDITLSLTFGSRDMSFHEWWTSDLVVCCRQSTILPSAHIDNWTMWWV